MRITENYTKLFENCYCYIIIKYSFDYFILHSMSKDLSVTHHFYRNANIFTTNTNSVTNTQLSNMSKQKGSFSLNFNL